MSGAMMRRISCWSSVFNQTGRRPSVVPLFGSVPINGTGMNGAVAGLNHPGAAGGNCGAAPPASGGRSSATQSALPSVEAMHMINAKHTEAAHRSECSARAINLSHRLCTTHLGYRFGETLYQPARTSTGADRADQECRGGFL